MKKNLDKLLVIITTAVVGAIVTIVFFVDLVCPQNIEISNGLSFGGKNAKVNLVVFEDFKCKYCKVFTKDILPGIKKEYIDTNKINYMIVPLSFIHGSPPIANAAIAIYELNRSQFFEFIKIISDEDIKIDTKQDLIEIATKLERINLEIFKEFLDEEIFNEYLKDNLTYAKKLMRARFQVPTIYINGEKIQLDEINDKIEEYLSYKEGK